MREVWGVLSWLLCCSHSLCPHPRLRNTCCGFAWCLSWPQIHVITWYMLPGGTDGREYMVLYENGVVLYENGSIPFNSVRSVRIFGATWVCTVHLLWGPWYQHFSNDANMFPCNTLASEVPRGAWKACNLITNSFLSICQYGVWKPFSARPAFSMQDTIGSPTAKPSPRTHLSSYAGTTPVDTETAWPLGPWNALRNAHGSTLLQTVLPKTGLRGKDSH